MLEIRETKLKGVFEILPKVFGDARGWFLESWSDRELKAAGIGADFVQDNHSFSAEKGTLRGLHYQLHPMAQAKILRVTRGEIFDVAADIRKGSPQYAKWAGVRLSAENKKQLFIPRGFAHGFITLTDSGRKRAKKIYERHTVLTDLLIGIGVSPDVAADDACKIEHDISDETFNAVKKHVRKNRGGR